uniref:hypothetical protein n=1 Tax=Deinococcus wulumuqiensis TaxID=980427 RepID=UPI001CEF9C41|nr:hypothetical protein [Deinococcus wulumuqiensis]
MIPSLVVGSAVAGAISMAMGCLLAAPHGGIFVLAIPGAVTNLPMYVVAIVAGTVVSTVLLGLLKRPLTERRAENSCPDLLAARLKVQPLSNKLFGPPSAGPFCSGPKGAFKLTLRLRVGGG